MPNSPSVFGICYFYLLVCLLLFPNCSQKDSDTEEENPALTKVQTHRLKNNSNNNYNGNQNNNEPTKSQSENPLGKRPNLFFAPSYNSLKIALSPYSSEEKISFTIYLLKNKENKMEKLLEREVNERGILFLKPEDLSIVQEGENITKSKSSSYQMLVVSTIARGETTYRIYDEIEYLTHCHTRLIHCDPIIRGEYLKTLQKPVIPSLHTPNCNHKDHQHAGFSLVSTGLRSALKSGSQKLKDYLKEIGKDKKLEVIKEIEEKTIQLEDQYKIDILVGNPIDDKENLYEVTSENGSYVSVREAEKVIELLEDELAKYESSPMDLQIMAETQEGERPTINIIKELQPSSTQKHILGGDNSDNSLNVIIESETATMTKDLHHELSHKMTAHPTWQALEKLTLEAGKKYLTPNEALSQSDITGFASQYAMTGAEEESAEIVGILLTGGSLAKALLKRAQTDTLLSHKIEVIRKDLGNVILPSPFDDEPNHLQQLALINSALAVGAPHSHSLSVDGLVRAGILPAQLENTLSGSKSVLNLYESSQNYWHELANIAQQTGNQSLKLLAEAMQYSLKPYIKTEGSISNVQPNSDLENMGASSEILTMVELGRNISIIESTLGVGGSATLLAAEFLPKGQLLESAPKFQNEIKALYQGAKSFIPPMSAKVKEKALAANKSTPFYWGLPTTTAYVASNSAEPWELLETGGEFKKAGELKGSLTLPDSSYTYEYEESRIGDIDQEGKTSFPIKGKFPPLNNIIGIRDNTTGEFRSNPYFVPSFHRIVSEQNFSPKVRGEFNISNQENGSKSILSEGNKALDTLQPASDSIKNKMLTLALNPELMYNLATALKNAKSKGQAQGLPKPITPPTTISPKTYISQKPERPPIVDGVPTLNFNESEELIHSLDQGVEEVSYESQYPVPTPPPLAKGNTPCTFSLMEENSLFSSGFNCD